MSCFSLFTNSPYLCLKTLALSKEIQEMTYYSMASKAQFSSVNNASSVSTGFILNTQNQIYKN